MYNILNQQRKVQVDDELETDIGFRNSDHLLGTAYQTPRFAQLTLAVDF